MSPVVSYVQAQTLAEAFDALEAGARPIAGGTDLVVSARVGKAPLPERLVSIDRIAELKGIDHGEATTTIAAGVSHRTIATDRRVREVFPALADASSIVGSHATQHVGTVGGNVMNASPAGETPSPLLCFDAVASLVSREGVRRVPLNELFVGPGRTSAREDELLSALDLVVPPPGSGSAYVRLQYRRQMEVAVVGAAAAVSLRDGLIQSARISLTAVGPTVYRAPEVEEALVGREAAGVGQGEVRDLTAAASSPISDTRASANYRRQMVGVMAGRAFAVALGRARGEQLPIPASLSSFDAVEGSS